MREPFVEIDCPVCGSKVHKVVFSLTPNDFLNDFRKSYYNLGALGVDLHTKFYFKKCKQCSFVFVNPRFRDDMYDIAYNEAKEAQYEHNDWRYGEEDLAKLYNTHSKFYASINLLEIISYVKTRFGKVKNEGHKPIKLLDFGCGFGHILDLCKPFGIDATGVDIDEARLDFCRRKGLNVCKPHELSIECKFDVVISWSVIEHVNDINAYFRYISDRLVPCGIFMVHGLNDKIIFWERIRKKFKYVMPIEHINYFTPKSMNHMISKHGFKTVPRIRIVQSIDSPTRYFYPMAKYFFKGFYPNGILKMELIKVSE